MRFMKGLFAVAIAGGAILSLSVGANAQAIISNGTISLGVRDLGHLGLDGGAASNQGNTTVGVRLLRGGAVGELEYTADGCVCEGWGVADASTGETGFANVSSGTGGLTFNSFGSTATTATSDVSTTGGNIGVVHDYHPSASANLYEATVTITNLGASAIGDLRYRRVMDWDIEPTAFNEFVTIQGWPATALLHTSDNGFNSADPLSAFGGNPALDNVNFTDNGPTDHGALFDFAFGSLAVGASKTFQIYYGGADTEADALAALGVVGAEVYSFGKPNLNAGGDPDGASSDPAFSVAIFGFKGVGGTPVGGVPEPGTLAMLAGLGVSGLGLFLRRRR